MPAQAIPDQEETRMSEQPAARTRYLRCPCGESIEADNEDTLVELTQAHLKASHPGHEYTRDQILFMAT
jgi:hypothetical protein